MFFPYLKHEAVSSKHEDYPKFMLKEKFFVKTLDLELTLSDMLFLSRRAVLLKTADN